MLDICYLVLKKDNTEDIPKPLEDISNVFCENAASETLLDLVVPTDRFIKALQ